jgi:hypothetical protein
VCSDEGTFKCVSWAHFKLKIHHPSSLALYTFAQVGGLKGALQATRPVMFGVAWN